MLKLIELLTELFADYDSFRQLVQTVKSDNRPESVIKIKIRPLSVAGKKHFQTEFYTAKQVRHKNYPAESSANLLQELLLYNFLVIDILTTKEAIQVKKNKKQELFITRGKIKSAPVLENKNNQSKNYLFPENQPNDFLIKLGFSDKNGKILSAKYNKFRQINHFLSYMTALEIFCKKHYNEELLIIDCGCGKAYLSLAVLFWATKIKNLPVKLIGLDTNPYVVSEAAKLAVSLNLNNAEFIETSIENFIPATAPGLVFSLHACDTATDMALALAVNHNARHVMAIPCCQHELHDQMTNPAFKTIIRHRILKERLADIYTDTLRALKMRSKGYKTEVIEFISEEFTAKNIMIRAERIDGSDPDRASFEKEYRELLDYLKVEPVIEKLIKV